MDLFLYPEAATNKDGYGIGVKHAYQKETPQKDDVIVWLSTYPINEMTYYRDEDYVLRRRSFFSFRSVWNLLTGRIRSELNSNDLSFLKGKSFDTIHCDDIVFYNALRQLYPKQHIRLRLHNCFSRIAIRNQFLNRNVGWKYALKFRSVVALEKKIFSDRNVYKIFISDEDRDFYRSTYGIISDSETWEYNPNMEKAKENRKEISLSHKLVWFGGVEAHKESSVQWFIKDVLPKIKQSIPDVEFHLWGKNTLKFKNAGDGVYAHGFYNGAGLPSNNSLYVNPDIIGGGIKLKLMTLIEGGVPFISTPFGFEGYKKELIDNKFCVVEEEAKWAERIVDILLNKK